MGRDDPMSAVPASRTQVHHVARRARTAGWYLLLTALAVIILFPIYMMVVRALSTPVTYFGRGSPLYPVDVEWGVFRAAWDEGGIGRSMGVSTVATLLMTGGQVVTAILAAYAFAFLRFPLRRLVFVLFIGTLMLPIEVTLIPNVQTMRDLHWLNSFPGLVGPFLASALGTFLIHQGFRAIPTELLDAASLDGYGHMRFLTRVAVPLSKPVIASFTVIAFLGAWNQFIWPEAVSTETHWQTVQIGVAALSATTPDHSNIAFAGAIVASLPLVVLLVAFQRQLVRGLTAGAVKG